MDREDSELSAFVVCQHCGKKYRAITAPHLRNIHGYEDEHPIVQYKSEFGLRFAISRDSRQKISEAKESFWDERGQHWKREDVLDEIRRIHEAGGSLRGRQVPVSLYETGRRLFGTWQAAVEAAGFDYEQVSGVRRWNRERVVERIRRLAAAGVPLNATYIQQHYPALHSAAIVQFPRSWARALEAAGFDPEEHKMPRGLWDKQRAAQWVKNRVAEKQSILARDAPRELVWFVYQRLHVPWTDFVESLGIPYPGVKKCRDWTREKALSEIRRLGAEGHPLYYSAVASDYPALIHQSRKFFGSWDRARAEAGV